MGAAREVIVVPGNHDAALVRPFLRARGMSPALDASLPLDATPLLARTASFLAPARVRVHYPGIWLSERVWATHGHYLDRHLLPEVAYGIARGLLGRVPRDDATPVEYEQPGGPSLTRLEALLTRWLPRPLAALAEDAAELLRAASMPGVPRGLLGQRIAPLNAALLGLQMRRASIPALARVVHRLGVEAESVIFGHVHRLGPLAGDDLRRWRGPDGTPPHLQHRRLGLRAAAAAPRARAAPLLARGAVVVEAGEAPRATGLLDHLEAAALSGP